ncbi:hypothetical protein EDB83DRAFT_2370152, partial [Lactarius deliciosus]
MAPARSILAAMLLALVGLPRSPASASAEPFTSAQEYDEFYHHGLDEVNLLEELSAAPSSSNTLRPIAFPSTEIGVKIHKHRLCPPNLSAARCRPMLHDASPCHPCYAPQIVSPHTCRRPLLPRVHHVYAYISYL